MKMELQKAGNALRLPPVQPDPFATVVKIGLKGESDVLKKNKKTLKNWPIIFDILKINILLSFNS